LVGILTITSFSRLEPSNPRTPSVGLMFLGRGQKKKCYERKRKDQTR